jgi:hypothetical protein
MLNTLFVVEYSELKADNEHEVKNKPEFDSEQHSNSTSQSGYAALCAIIITTVVFLAMYFRLSRVDPGFVRTSATHPRTGKPLTMLDCAIEGVSTERFCSACELFMDNDVTMPHTGVRHCRLCEHCVRDQDHHCIFLTRCITRRYVPLFVGWLVLDCMLQFTFIALTCCFATHSYADTMYQLEADGSYFVSLLRYVSDIHWFVILAGMNVVTSCWATTLIVHHARVYIAVRSGHGDMVHDHAHERCIITTLCDRLFPPEYC